ncbi:MAG: hypothetical protein M0Z94_00905 [Dehalococcoidales bacterium]|nr:hypothetical protein [Dehalococcoidales bacterium]
MALNAANLLRLAQSAPTAAKIYSAWQRARRGDRQAIDYLRSEGWAEAVDLLVAPGAGAMAKEALGHATDAYRTLKGIRPTPGGDVVDAEYRVLEETEAEAGPRPPWSPFLKRLFSQRYGGHIVIGPYGSGKTSAALRLAQVCREGLGYTVETVAMYEEDRPEWAVPLNKETLIHRAKKIARYLNSQGVRDPDEPIDPDLVEEDDGTPPTLPAGGKVIVIDEASAAMGLHDPTRAAVMLALYHCRHVDWIVIFIAQMAALLPEPLLGQSVKWVKRPTGDEDATDRNNRVVRELWRAAGEAFGELRRSPWYQEPYRDWRAWAYCDARALDTGPGYRGLIPFGKPERGQT